MFRGSRGKYKYPVQNKEDDLRLRVMIDTEGRLSISHRRKGAAKHTNYMVCLFSSPIPVGRRGAFYLFK
jgi:hypothetical protein